jgi:hypothetical protein
MWPKTGFEISRSYLKTSITSAIFVKKPRRKVQPSRGVPNAILSAVWFTTVPSEDDLRHSPRVLSPNRLHRECQQADWKKGRNGRTHKQICGKPLKESLGVNGDSISDETGDEDPPFPDIPPPAPGFRRSAALLHQITFLVQPPYVNYVVCG